jgi:hypothetical protein
MAICGLLAVLPASAPADALLGASTVYGPFDPYNHDAYSGYPYRASPTHRAEEANRLYASYFGVAPTVRLDPIEPNDPELPPPPPEAPQPQYQVTPRDNNRLYDSRYESAFDRYPPVRDYYVAPPDGSPSYIVTDRPRGTTEIVSDRTPQLQLPSAEQVLREPRHPDNPLDADNWRVLYSRGVDQRYDANVGYGRRTFVLNNPNPYSAHGLDNPNYWNDRQSTQWGHHRFDARFYRDDARGPSPDDVDQDGRVGTLAAGRASVGGDSRFVFDKYDQLYSPYGHGPAPTAETPARYETLRMPTEAYDSEATLAGEGDRSPAYRYPPHIRVPSGLGGPVHDSRDLPRIDRDGGDPHRGPSYDFDGVIEAPPQDRRIPDHAPVFDFN